MIDFQVSFLDENATNIFLHFVTADSFVEALDAAYDEFPGDPTHVYCVHVEAL